MTTYEEHDGECVATVYGPGRTFVHPPHAHEFVNHGEGPVEFYVAYFVPAGTTPLLNDAARPEACD